MFAFVNNKVKFNRVGVKYIANFVNLDKKYVFERKFINGFDLETHGNTFIIEVADTSNNKKIYVLDSKNKTVTETKIEDLKKEKNEDAVKFCAKYFK